MTDDIANDVKRSYKRVKDEITRVKNVVDKRMKKIHADINNISSKILSKYEFLAKVVAGINTFIKKCTDLMANLEKKCVDAFTCKKKRAVSEVEYFLSLVVNASQVCYDHVDVSYYGDNTANNHSVRYNGKSYHGGKNSTFFKLIDLCNNESTLQDNFILFSTEAARLNKTSNNSYVNSFPTRHRGNLNPFLNVKEIATSFDGNTTKKSEAAYNDLKEFGEMGLNPYNLTDNGSDVVRVVLIQGNPNFVSFSTLPQYIRLHKNFTINSKHYLHGNRFPLYSKRFIRENVTRSNNSCISGGCKPTSLNEDEPSIQQNVYYDRESYKRHDPIDKLYHGKVYHVRQRRGIFGKLWCKIKQLLGFFFKPICKMIFRAIAYICQIPKLLTNFVSGILLGRLSYIQKTIKSNLWIKMDTNLTFSRKVIAVRSKEEAATEFEERIKERFSITFPDVIKLGNIFKALTLSLVYINTFLYLKKYRSSTAFDNLFIGKYFQKFNDTQPVSVLPLSNTEAEKYPPVTRYARTNQEKYVCNLFFNFSSTMISCFSCAPQNQKMTSKYLTNT